MTAREELIQSCMAVADLILSDPDKEDPQHEKKLSSLLEAVGQASERHWAEEHEDDSALMENN